MTITVAALSEQIREVTRSGCPTAYLLTAEALADVGDVRDEDARWRLVKARALAKRRKREETKV